jgi:hypothetical protein
MFKRQKPINEFEIRWDNKNGLGTEMSKKGVKLSFAKNNCLKIVKPEVR